MSHVLQGNIKARERLNIAEPVAYRRAQATLGAFASYATPVKAPA